MAWGKPRRKSKALEVPIEAPFVWPRLVGEEITFPIGGGTIGPLTPTEVPEVFAWLGEGGLRYYRVTRQKRPGMEPMTMVFDVTARIENQRAVEERREARLEVDAKRMRGLDIGSVIGPTPETKAKVRQRPDVLRRLLLAEKIDGTEMRAAEEIERIFMLITSPMISKSGGMETGGGGAQRDFFDRIRPMWDAWRLRYMPWAAMLEAWKVRHNTWPIHAVVIAIVVEGWSIREVEEVNEMRHGTAAPALVLGLKSYATGAGWRRPAREKKGCALKVGLPTTCEVCGDSSDPAVKALWLCKPPKERWPDMDAPPDAGSAPAGYYTRVTPAHGPAPALRIGQNRSAIDQVMTFLPKAKKGKNR